MGAIVVEGGRVLLLKRKKEPEARLWGIQGGAIEFGETAEAARRGGSLRRSWGSSSR